MNLCTARKCMRPTSPGHDHPLEYSGGPTYSQMKVKQFCRKPWIGRLGGTKEESMQAAENSSKQTCLATRLEPSPVTSGWRPGIARANVTCVYSAPRLTNQQAKKKRDASRVLPPIRSCILIFYYGGPSHIDMYDMKPDAPAEIRGQFGSIATSVPGLRVCEHLRQTAGVMDRLAIVRSMHHPMTNHNAAAFAALCGRDPLKGDLELLSNDRNDPPCYGAILSANMREARVAHVCRIAARDV